VSRIISTRTANLQRRAEHEHELVATVERNRQVSSPSAGWSGPGRSGARRSTAARWAKVIPRFCPKVPSSARNAARRVVAEAATRAGAPRSRYSGALRKQQAQIRSNCRTRTPGRGSSWLRRSANRHHTRKRTTLLPFTARSGQRQRQSVTRPHPVSATVAWSRIIRLALPVVGTPVQMHDRME
jgi:hypothetical protein